MDSLRNGKGPNEESIENLEQIDFIEAVENNDFEQSDDVVDHYSNKNDHENETHQVINPSMSPPPHNAYEPWTGLPPDSSKVSEPRPSFSTENHMQSSRRIDPMANVQQENYHEQDNTANEVQRSLSVQHNVGAGPLRSPKTGSHNNMHNSSSVSLNLKKFKQ